jgi:RimJ/RimL family protein N-acetyltransferase|tara:strand:- start:143 stop:538 length:396 start_codon:yes stop_codon:yes gene_type:complete
LALVRKSDATFLYDLLKERESNVNISHKKMPTYAQHIKFIESRPYSKWYVIILNNQKIGSAYLSKQNEIGIFITKNKQRKKLGTSVLDMIIKKNHRKRYLANVNPKNKKSISFFKKNGFELIQHTFELELS